VGSGVDDLEATSFVARAAQRGSALDQLPSLSAWQRRMERYPQLPAAEQNHLVVLFQTGRHAEAELRSGKRVGSVKERTLRHQIRDGERAIELLAGANFRLLYLISRAQADERFGKDKATKLLPDLVAEANVALVEAAVSYDGDKGPAFPTYLAKVVRDKVLASLSRQHMVKSPPSWNRVKRIYTVRQPKLTEELGRVPTLDEMKADLLRVCMEWAEDKLSPAQRTQSPGEQEEAKLDRLRKQGMLGAIAKLEEVLSATQVMGSMDAPLGDDGGTLSDVLGGDADADDVSVRVEQQELAKAVADMLAELDPREREIVMYRYGFVDGESWTYAKISERYGVSPERIRQIERAVVKRLQLPHAQYSALAAFVEE
jgi:RNA polymerase sigma factor (sigma-70 family)